MFAKVTTLMNLQTCDWLTHSILVHFKPTPPAWGSCRGLYWSFLVFASTSFPPLSGPPALPRPRLLGSFVSLHTCGVDRHEQCKWSHWHGRHTEKDSPAVAIHWLLSHDEMARLLVTSVGPGFLYGGQNKSTFFFPHFLYLFPLLDPLMIPCGAHRFWR